MTIKWNDLTMKRIVAPIVSLFFLRDATCWIERVCSMARGPIYQQDTRARLARICLLQHTRHIAV